MLAFAPLAAAPLASAAAAGLPEILVQAARVVALGGGAGAYVAGSAQAGQAQALPLGGQVKAHAVARGQGLADLGLIGAARAESAGDVSLRGDIRLSGDVAGEARAVAAASPGLALSAAAASAVGVSGTAAVALDLQRRVAAKSQIEGGAAPGLALRGGIAGSLRVGASVVGAWDLGIAARVHSRGTLGGGSAVSANGTASASGLSAGTMVGRMPLAGAGLTTSRIAAHGMARIEISGQATADIGTGGRIAVRLPGAGRGAATVLTQSDGALALVAALHAATVAALRAENSGDASLTGQAVSATALTASGGPVPFALTGYAAGTILAPRIAEVSGALRLTGRGYAAGALMALGQAAIGITGSTQTGTGTRVTVRGHFGVAPDLRSDGDLRGASMSRIGFSVAAAAWTASAGSTSKSVVEITGRGVVRSAASAECTVSMALRGAAGTRLGATATVTTSAAIGWIIKASATTPQNAQGQGALPLTGAAAGAIINQPTADGVVALAGAANAITPVRIVLADGTAMTLRGQATGDARTRARSTGRIAVTRLGLGGVCIAGGAARGMAVLGAAQARGMTEGVADLRLKHRLSGAASNLIRMELAAREMGAAGRGIAQASILGIGTDPDLVLGLTSYAFRAPPALRRSEPPRIGLSGRLMPSNAGRILRG